MGMDDCLIGPWEINKRWRWEIGFHPCSWLIGLGVVPKYRHYWLTILMFSLSVFRENAYT